MAIEVGAKVSGKVSGITSFGAFVDLDDHQTGLVHISQISDKYIKDVHDVLSVGDTVTVKVTRIGDDGKIALSMKAAAPHEEHSESHEHGHYNRHQHGYGRRPHYEHNNNFHSHSDNFRGGFNGGNHHSNRQHEDFNEMMAGYLKESESRLSKLKRRTDGKRGGRGGRRA